MIYYIYIYIMIIYVFIGKPHYVLINKNGTGWLVDLKKMSSSIGMITFPTEWKRVPNHQPDKIIIEHHHLIPFFWENSLP